MHKGSHLITDKAMANVSFSLGPIHLTVTYCNKSVLVLKNTVISSRQDHYHDVLCMFVHHYHDVACVFVMLTAELMDLFLHRVLCWYR